MVWVAAGASESGVYPLTAMAMSANEISVGVPWRFSTDPNPIMRLADTDAVNPWALVSRLWQLVLPPPRSLHWSIGHEEGQTELREPSAGMQVDSVYVLLDRFGRQVVEDEHVVVLEQHFRQQRP